MGPSRSHAIEFAGRLKNGNLSRQQKKPDRLCIRNTLRALVFFAFLHLSIFERPVNFVFSAVRQRAKTQICSVLHAEPYTVKNCLKTKGIRQVGEPGERA